MPVGYRWAGRITQLQVFTDSRAINGISLILENEDRAEFQLIKEARVSRSLSPLNLVPLMGLEQGIQITGDSVIKAQIQFPQNVEGGSFITILGFSEETGLPAVPELGGGGSGGGGGGGGQPGHQPGHQVDVVVSARALGDQSSSILFI